MNPNQLSATTNSSSQTTTESPQTAGQPANANTRSENLQPGTATALLNGQGSVPLIPQTLPAVGLTSGSTGSPAPATPAKSFNSALLILPIVLCLIAALLFWLTMRSAKKPNY